MARTLKPPGVRALLDRLFARRAEAAAFVQGLLARGIDLDAMPGPAREALGYLAQGDQIISDAMAMLRRVLPAEDEIAEAGQAFDAIDDLMDSGTATLKAYVREVRPPPAAKMAELAFPSCPCGSGKLYASCCARRALN